MFVEAVVSDLGECGPELNELQEWICCAFKAKIVAVPDDCGIPLPERFRDFRRRLKLASLQSAVALGAGLMQASAGHVSRQNGNSN